MSRASRGHPSDFHLSQFVDGQLDPRDHDDVARHVELCVVCHTEVRFYEELREATRELGLERPAPDVADAVIARRRAGEREYPAPTASARAASRGRFAGAVAAGLTFVAAVSAYLLLAPSAAATRGELSFGAVADASDAVPVDYRPAYYLADEDSLRLRARVHASAGAEPGGREETIREATLRRRADGTFTGRLSLEPGDVFAVAAVEDFAGGELDTNSGRLWELYVASERGEPTFAALESHYRALESYNPVLAWEWAEGLRQDHPANPLAWALAYRNLTTLDPDPADSVRSFHRAKLEDLLRSGDPSAGELAWLAVYAGYLEEPALRDRLLERLAVLDPDHPAILDRRVFEAMQAAESGSAERVERLERLWEATRRPSVFLVHAGVQAAAAAGRQAATRTWLERGLQHGDVNVAALAADLAPYPDLAGERARLLRRRLDQLESAPEANRGLRSTALEHLAARRNEILGLEISLADALVDAGEEAAAAGLFESAAHQIWRSDDVRPYVDFLLARGDTTAAMPILGLLAADPIDGDRARTTYSEVIEARVDDIESFLAGSRDDLARRIQDGLSPGSRLRGDTRMTLLPGEETTARDYLAGRPGILLFWDARFDPDFGGLTAFEDLAGREWAGDVRPAVVLPGPIEPEAAAVGAGRLPVLVDAEQELRRQIQQFALPLFVVLDPRLGIVATSADPALAYRVAKSLSWSNRDMTDP